MLFFIFLSPIKKLTRDIQMGKPMQFLGLRETSEILRNNRQCEPNLGVVSVFILLFN